MFGAFFKLNPEQQDMRNRFESRMRSIIKDEELQKHLIPPFEAGCRRINPGEQFLISIQEPNVKPVFDSIERVTPTGIIAGGIEYPTDVIITATGFNTSFKPRFPIIGRKGVNLQHLWGDDPISYFGTGVSGFPNLLIYLGPNTPISNGSLMGT
jgi:cation diffusion facilitator CzcD-associated flavoprotein CzcO